jgi:chorismate mutase
MSHLSQIQTIRENIDDVNNRLVSLLLERKQLSKNIGNIKKQLGIPVYDASREKNIYDSLKAKYPNDYEYLKPIFEAIILSSRNVQS